MGNTISVIVPVYNVEKYLDECIESIVSQSYTNFELILVDDGSPDKCPEICDEWAKRDNRIKVIHKENGGVSSARNAGIDAASGEFIMFIDSDDTIRQGCFERSVEMITKYDVDIYFFRRRIEKTNGNVNCDSTKRKPLLCNTKEFIELCYLKDKDIPLATVWGKLYKREVIVKNGIVFDIGSDFGEDADFNFNVYVKAKKLLVDNIVFYNYIMREGSLVTKYRENQFELTELGYMRKKQFINEVGVCDEVSKAIDMEYARKNVFILHTSFKFKKQNNFRHRWNLIKKAEKSDSVNRVKVTEIGLTKKNTLIYFFIKTKLSVFTYFSLWLLYKFFKKIL